MVSLSLREVRGDLTGFRRVTGALQVVSGIVQRNFMKFNRIFSWVWRFVEMSLS